MQEEILEGLVWNVGGRGGTKKPIFTLWRTFENSVTPKWEEKA